MRSVLPKASQLVVQRPIAHTFRSRPVPPIHGTGNESRGRVFSITTKWRKEDYAAKAKELNQKGLDEHEKGFNTQIDDASGEAKELQARTPWHREGSDQPPVKRMRSAGAMTKGAYFSPKLITKADRLECRQTPHHAISSPEIDPTPNNPGQEYRPQIHRAFSTARSPTTASLLP